MLDIINKSFYKIDVDKNKIEFYSNDGDKYIMEHEQDCCEQVFIEDINGDINDLLNTPILKYEEVTKRGDNTDDESSTWTFYKFATIKGYLTIRWLGISNGYYSESVDFYKHKQSFLKELRDHKLNIILDKK